MSVPYNGWTNYETWNLKLWIDNEEGSYRYWQEEAEHAYKNAKASKSFSKVEQATLDLAKALERETEDNAPEVTGFYADVLNAAIGSVNWYEIAESLIEEVDKDEEEDETDDMSNEAIRRRLERE